ncbi:hypothetical protein G7B40_032655 [Aetokthonos hydrillicola Thurmond2011]|jgi:hypothetical protein|uniref:Uncharacterized protein n=1 Tax=Aetokthonos hydrillicola Thurmond2011 TaxID=2712845 RepID=A0AAP5IFM4_9CYAN|nr:hypothetical protein [Aetokthonos hydrillicola]MBO3462642.1 hypothetical protein [Aetokthonos hydrillicola CCALA 1050]MBW4585774.1 hypothetical protein [Aetokthonos hydrillicola CCALA 1050]MDR9899277.1 hypothetical protein [Aetokthonos hydrillicola Thurmond2011]
MPEEIKPNPQEAPTQDAQLAAENIASGEEKAPTVNMEADYKAAQKFSTASGDNVSQQQESPDSENQQAGNPENYTAMAKDVAQSKDK